MGTHGYAGLNRLLNGSMAEAVMRRADVPVMAVHERLDPPKYSRILVPHNMTPYADKALAYALDFAKGNNSTLEVLHVTAHNGLYKARAAQGLSSHLISIVGKRRTPKINLRIMSGDPREAILVEAKRGKFDLIILSAHKKPLLKDFIMGSTAERVLRHAPIPVLCVPSAGTNKWSDAMTELIPRPQTIFI